MSARVAFEQLSAWYGTWVQRIVETATTSAAPGDARWDAVLDELGVERLSLHERWIHVSASAQRHGPPPIEVERAFAVIAEQARSAARRLQFAPGVDEDRGLDRELDRFELQAARTVEDHLQRVVAALRPPPVISSIFANAAATTRGNGPAQTAEVATLACPQCGAPRRGTRDDRVCAHCSSRF